MGRSAISVIGITRLEHRRGWKCRVASDTSMFVLLKRRIQWRMTNDFSHLSRIGKRSSCNGYTYSCFKNLEGIAKRSKVCGRPKLKSNMLALRRPQNGWERTRILGSDLSGEVRNQKKLHSRRSLQSLLNARPLLESSNRVYCSGGDNSVSIGPLQVSEQYHTDAWNQNKSFALSRSRDLELAENTVDWSDYFKDALVKKDRETLARTRYGVPRGPARENDWCKVLRRIQQCDPNAYNDIIKTLASQSGRIPEPSFYPKSEAVKTLKASELKRGFPMPARKNKLCFSPATMRGSKMPSSLRESKVRKSVKGIFHKAGGSSQTPSVIGARSPLTPFKAAGLKQLYPSVLRRSQIRFRCHLSEGRRPDRVLPGSVLHLGRRRAPWGANRDKAAIFLQAQWRMCLARRSYQSVQRATLSIQRQWRETKGLPSHINATLDVIEKETSVGGSMKSDICSQANVPHELSVEKSAAATQCKDLTGKDNQRSLKMSGLSVERLYDSNISAIQEDEIFDEFLGFLPCNEPSSVNVLSTPTRTGRDPLLQSHSLRLAERSLETSHSPVSPESSRVELAEDDEIILQSSTSTKTWNYDMCNLDSPACSPAQELTFARISIDGSLPPTPIKDWSSRKQDPVKRSSAVPVVWDPSSTLDVVELHPSPTKDWASPLTRGRKPPLILRGSPDADLERERFQLPSEWFMDLDELDIPESCWDTSKVTSISFSPPSDPHLKSLYRFPSVDSEMMVPSSGALVCIPEESAHNVFSPHENRNCPLIANSAVIEKSPISVKLTADSSMKTVDHWRWRDTNFSDEDVDGSSLSTSANVPTETTDSRLDCPLSPALEEELLDELTKLFQGSPDPAVCPSDISGSLAGHLCSANDLRCSDSLRSSHPKALSRVCSGTLGKDGFSGSSARKLNFNFEDEDGLADGKDNQEVSDSNQHHDGDHQMPVKNLERMLVQDGNSLSLLSMLPNFTLSQPAICASQGSDEKFDGHDQKHLQIFEELDNVRASSASRSYSKSCQSTVTDFLQLVENNLATSRGDAHHSPERCTKRSSLPPSPEPQLPRFEDEDGFCDKAVDGNVVAVKDTTYQVRDLLPGPFHGSIGWEAASATDSPNGFFGPPIECAALDNLDTSFTRRVSSFVTPKMQRSSTAITRSCGAINKTKPPLPVKSRRISFDQINYKFNEQLTPADEMKPLLPENKVSDRLLHSSPVSPDTPLASFTVPSGYLLRSSALSVSKKYFLQSPSSRMQSGKCDSDTESVVSPASSNSAKKESSLEGVEKKTSAKHARALFTCQQSALPKTSEDGILKSASLPSWNDVYRFSCFENNYEAMLKHRDAHRLWFPDTLSGPLLLTSGAESDCSFRKSTSSAWDCGLMTLMTDGGFANIENISPSLHDLCKVWEDESMDLVTRSLKYKSLMTDSDLLRQELEVAFEKNEPSSPQTIAWEIQNIERLKEKLESRERLNELVRQQRDTIYINIATNASMRERYRLYSKWGIRRMSRGRLRKVIYELLWKDPKRYHASADLVLQYL